MDIIDRLITRVQLQGAAGYMRGLQQMGTALTANQAAALALRQQMNLQAVAVGTAAVALLGYAHAALLTAEATDKLRNRFSAVFRGPDAAGRGLAYAREQARRLHEPLEDVAETMAAIAMQGRRPTARLLQEAQVLAQRSGKAMADTARDLTDAYNGNTKALREYGMTLQQVQALAKNPPPRTQFSKDLEDIKNFWTDLKSIGGGFSEQFVHDLADLARYGDQVIDFMRRVADGIKAMVGGLGAAIAGRLADWAKALHLPTAGAWEKTYQKLLREAQGDWRKAVGPRTPRDGPDPLTNPLRTGMDAATRQFLGGGTIGRIGVNASELPGIRARMNNAPVVVRIEPEDTMQEIVNRTIAKLTRHGVIRPATG